MFVLGVKNLKFNYNYILIIQKETRQKRNKVINIQFNFHDCS